MPHTYEYQRPAFTVDILIFVKEKDELSVLLIQRDKPPFEGLWAFPGGFVDIDETLEDASLRELKEETSITGIELQQLYTFGALDRDPRHRTVTVVYYGFAPSKDIYFKAADDARNAAWFNVKNIPQLAFDHEEILKKYLNKK
jgi:8-oxo-dGTP diphosphatase